VGMGRRTVVGLVAAMAAGLVAVPGFAAAAQLVGRSAGTAPAVSGVAAAPPGPGQQLGTTQAMYPRVIRLQHAGSANGRLIASVSVSVGGGGTDSAQFLESSDGGTSFRPLSTISDPLAGSDRGSCCGSLFELPRPLGDQPAGTLLFATTVGMPSKAGRVPEIRVWSSEDQAHTWSYLSSCASAPDAPADRGLWEPELSLDARGYLHCYFSDDARSVTGSHTGFDQTIADVTSTDGGHTWSPERNVVAIPSTTTATYRPGMATVRELPGGTYLMSYELCGSGLPNACQVFVRSSADGWNWGAATDPGTVVSTREGRHLFHAPTIAWAPGGGPHGRVLLIGGLVKDGNGTILRPASGSTILVNTRDGAGLWSQLDAPVTVGFSAAPDSQELVCNNYSSTLLPLPDGNDLLEIATRRDTGGACRAYVGTAPAAGTGDNATIASGRTYGLANANSGGCLDVPAGATTAGTLLQQWTCNGLDPQNWKLVAKTGGYYTVTNERSGLCLDVPNSSTLKGVRLRQWTCNGTAAQLWQVVNAGTGVNLVSKASGRCAEVNAGSAADGAVVQQWTCNGAAWQVWRPRQPLAVMALGDSITDGLDGTGGYRADLWQLFHADGRYVDFVGSQSAGPARLADLNHEGHPGWRIDQVDAQVAGWLNTYQPDTVLLHLGTNDIIQDYALAQAPARLSALLDHITATVPTADVYVATIVPFANATDEAQAEAYNAQLPGIVQAKAGAGKHVHLLDMHAALTPADLLSDGVHPSNGGYSKMAAQWYAQVHGTSVNRWEAEASGNTLTDATVVATANASGNLKVGHLDNADSSVEFTVSVAAAGSYRVYVRAADGTETPCTHTVTVNGQPAGELTYAAYGWDQWVIAATNVSLNAGSNSIRFTHGTCYAELDSIDVPT
jgi:lysophospholipase L1-like esterase